MKKFLGNLIQFMLSGYFVLSIFKGITLPENSRYFVACLIMISTGVFLSTLILKFLTIKENFLTSFLMILILSIGISFLLQEFMPGFNISEYTFEGFSSGSITIKSFLVTPIISMVLLSVTHALISSLLKVFEKNS